MAENSRILIDAVIFDYGEVLSERADPVHIANMARIAGIGEQAVTQFYWKFRDEYDRGTFDGQSYWAAIAEAAGAPFSGDQISALIQEDVKSWSRIRKPMLAWLDKLQRAGIKTAVLSNMMTDLLAHMRQEFDWLNAFTCQTYSCEIGAVKPEEKIYRHVLNNLAVPAGRALFVDDREINIQGARAAGMHGIVFKSLESLRDELARGYNVPLPDLVT
ncbi:MAG: HAD-superfamily hydrolase subfamily variant 3 [Bryobacterales bacterium]|nr:HAD-superfamily hydrolase subfamily variant 3 [Bryobacterales bacterium]